MKRTRKKQSVVEWFIENSEDFFGGLLSPSITEKANKMFEEQIIDAWNDGVDSLSSSSAKEYFDENFKSKKNTPREEAVELIEMFWTEVEDNEYQTRKMSFKQAKKCALISIENTIKSHTSCDECKEEGSVELGRLQEIYREIINL
jgi:hypothetical protein